MPPARGEADGQSSAAASSSSSSSLLLPFARTLIRSLVPADDEPLDEGDALLILARGLGLRTIVAHILKIYDAPTNLVLLVNAQGSEEAGLSEELTTLGVRKPGLRAVGYETSQAKRKGMYAQGGLLSVTSQILITDMLNETVPIELVTGIVFLHAESVTPESNEAFIAGVYRDRNQDGFLKAFSDNVTHFSLGLAPLQTVLTKLRIRRVDLYPRFHKSVIRDLGQRKADVVELHQPLSRSMRMIQTAIVECLEATLTELKKAVATLDVGGGDDDGGYSVENALFLAFDYLVDRQLQPVWHTLSAKTRRLARDLKELRSLLDYLISYDAVDFHEYLEMSRGAAVGAGGEQPYWWNLEASNVVFNTARARAYLGKVDSNATTTEPRVQHGDGAGGVDEDEDEIEAAGGAAASSSHAWAPKWLPPGITPVLEEQPKWHLLREVLDEIEQHLSFTEEKDISPNNTILIMTNGQRSARQVRWFLSSMGALKVGQEQVEEEGGEFVPGRKMLRQKLRGHFEHKAAVGRLNANLKLANQGKVAPIAKGSGPSVATNTAMSDALKRKEVWERGAGPPNKRRRQRGGGMVGSGSGGGGGRGANGNETPNDALEGEAADVAGFYERAMGIVAEHEDEDDEAGQDGEGLMRAAAEEVDDDDDGITAIPDEAQAVAAASTSALPPLDHLEGDQAAFTQVDFDNYFGVLDTDSLVIIRPYRNDDDDNVLRELRPRFIIMYDPDPSFVRRVELYRASTVGANPRVYFLLYAESVEEQRYLSSLRREKEAFEKLIREKSIMALPIQDGRPAQEDGNDRLLRSINSRNAGGQRGVTSLPPTIVVDMREFKSSLPPMLYAAGIKVVPCTLQVGDYILSPEMCVERKSLPDLIQSFNSGRLYAQCETMSVHYLHPILLIEFPQDKAFAMQSMVKTPAGGGGGGGGSSSSSSSSTTTSKGSGSNAKDPTEIDVQTKLVMLTISFPRLRIIWSSSPYHTADIFSELKTTYDEPDPVKVAAIGLSTTSGEGAGAGAGGAGGAGVAGTGEYESSFNLTPQDMLLAMPGITTKNVRHVMNSVRDLRELCAGVGDGEEEEEEGEGEGLEEADIQELIGTEPGRALWGFITRDLNGGKKRGRGSGRGRGGTRAGRGGATAGNAVSRSR
ncbi:hypothetical protein BDZ90DRAFT_260642 [Jaminaea rosea]|uniref:ERCC4 domain-containing protein n=1 Tax=Jaminaea rosea TaxID=1569628 RepID=A0A316URL5_9BASI|nr:hypothetical protein BDZ90DRAFT_260642 [Jaminaea rosea]PWN26961.1 hypothetical protein BDZ90DRAFT_260642 [Jaminaea rosea]